MSLIKEYNFNEGFLNLIPILTHSSSMLEMQTVDYTILVIAILITDNQTYFFKCIGNNNNFRS